MAMDVVPGRQCSKSHGKHSWHVLIIHTIDVVLSIYPRNYSNLQNPHTTQEVGPFVVLIVKLRDWRPRKAR